MLVLSRRPNESILIGGHTVITLLSVRGRIVRLGVEAPPATKVLRSELLLEEVRDSRAHLARGSTNPRT